MLVRGIELPLWACVQIFLDKFPSEVNKNMADEDMKKHALVC